MVRFEGKNRFTQRASLSNGGVYRGVPGGLKTLGIKGDE